MISWFRRYVLNNLLLKLVSLAIAIMLWLAVAQNPVTEVAVNVPLEFNHVPESLEISTERIPQIQLRLRGPERLVHALDPNQVHVSLDLAGATSGERTFDLTGRQIHVPSGVEVVQVVPSQFRISFDQRASKQVVVKPRVIGTFASGYRIAPDGVIPNPAEVTIIGPKKHVDAIESAITDPVDATGVVGRATFMTHVYVSDPLVHVANPGPVRVTVITEKIESAQNNPAPEKQKSKKLSKRRR